MDTWGIIYIVSALALLVANTYVARWYGNDTSSTPNEENSEL